MKNLIYLMSDDQRDANLLYGYTFLFDPFILAAIQGVPTMEPQKSFRRWDSADLLIACGSSYMLPKDRQLKLLDGVAAVLKRKGAAVLVQPSRLFYNRLPQLRGMNYRRDVVSLCEKWQFNTPHCAHVQDYPHRAIFQAVEGKGEVWSTVGDWPALMVKERLALFTVDQLRAFAKWRHGDHMIAHVNLWVDLVIRLLGAPALSLPETEMETDLRRDFHAFGYALILLRELARLQKKNIAAAERSACEQLMEAAGLFVKKQHASSQAKLADAFNILYAARLKITAMTIHLVDSCHGSTLYDDVGFAEMEWPQQVSEFIDYFSHLIEKRNFRLSLDWDAQTVDNLARRCPKLTSKMRRWVEEDKLEFINGGYVQQYPHFWSAPSAIQNFKAGRAVFQSVFGRPVVTYGGQECCMNPQMPNLLVKSGYRYALHRIQNFGHVPLVKEAAIAWRGKEGSTLPAVPGNPMATERLATTFYLLLAGKIHQSLEQGVTDPVFSNLQDLMMINFREEVCRIAYYAPIFGRHTTISEYFKKKGRPSLPVKSFDYSDYLYGYFYVGHGWRGNENNKFIQAFALERAIADGQFINGLAVFRQRSQPKDWEKHWQKICALQSHDALIAGNVFTGAFYRIGGPLDMSVTNAIKVDAGYAGLLADAGKTAARDLHRLSDRKGRRPVYVNTLGFPRRVIVGDKAGRWAEARIPAYGYSTSVVHTRGHVAVSEDALENDLISIRFNRQEGWIDAITDKTTGRKVVSKCNELVYGDASRMRRQEFEIADRSEHRVTVVIKGVICRKTEVLALYETRLTLADQSRVVDIKTSIVPTIDIPPNPCDHAFQFKMQLIHADVEVIRGYLNVAEPLREGPIYKQFFKFDPKPWLIFYKPSDPKMKMFCSPYYARLRARAETVDVFNDGAELYYRKGNCIYQHLIGSNDTLHEFHYAIAVNNVQRHPLLASLDWQTPVLTARTGPDSVWGLFGSDAPSLWLFGVEYIGDKTFLLRAAELAGRRTRTLISCGYGLHRVIETDYLGNPLRKIKSNKRQFPVDLPPWGISEFRVQFARKNRG